MVNLLGRDRQFVALDMRGCGLSDRHVEATGLDRWVSDIEAVVHTVGLERLVVVGLSQGCAPAIEYAARHPDKVAGLILCGGYAQGLGRRASATQTDRELGEALATMVEFGWGSDNVAFRQVFTSRFFPELTPEQNHWANQQMRSCATPTMAARLLREAYQIDVTEAARSITCL
jgi:pimeloyl-ACP methyl ester carboxylesterase